MKQYYMIILTTDVIKMNFKVEDIAIPSFQPLSYGFKSLEEAKKWIDENRTGGREMIAIPYYQ